MTLARRIVLYAVAQACKARVDRIAARLDRDLKRLEQARDQARRTCEDLRKAQDASLSATREYARAADVADWEGYEDAAEW